MPAATGGREDHAFERVGHRQPSCARFRHSRPTGWRPGPHAESCCRLVRS